MAGFIPQNLLEEILNRINIAEVICEYIPLKRAGRNFKALCPFHQEKTPSFMVSPERQIYHCFSCQKGGNAFKFLMDYERMEFPEAVETLAKKAGVVLPQVRPQDNKALGLVMQLYKINELAATFYAANLDSAEAQAAKNYLLKRSLKPETIKEFKLGVSTDKWDALMNYLRAKNVELSLLEKAGLVLAKENGGYYDRFRNRIILPIFDIKERVIGFGARVLDDSLPKYLNSPQTQVYSKGRNLYGLNLSHDAIREKDCAVVVEGYLDFLIPYQEGLRNITASLGTALTEEQARLLKRYTQNVVMVYDGDSAGELATLRTLDIFIEEGIHVKVAPLPQGFDPDAFVRKYGIDKFKEKIEAAENLFDYKLKILKAGYPIKEVEGKAQIASCMLLTINKFQNALIKSEYIKRLSEELQLKEEALLEELKKIKPDRPFEGFTQQLPRKMPDISPTEKLLVKLMLEEAGLINRIREHLEPADFQDARASRIVATLFDFIEQGKDMGTSVLIEHLGEEGIAQFVCESVFLETSLENKEKVVDDCIRRIKDERLRFKKQSLHEQIKQAQGSGDERRLKSLIQEFHQLIKK